MRKLNIGKLKGRYVVYWNDTEGVGDNIKKVRRRFRLNAKTKDEAWAEGGRVYDSQLALKGSKLTFEELVERYLKYLGDRKSATDIRNLWKSAGAQLGYYDPLKIDDEVISRYLDYRREHYYAKRGKEISNGSLHSEVNQIQTVLNFGKKKKLISEDPHKLSKPPKPRPKERWLTDDEIERLLSETVKTPHLHVAVILLLSTAGRIGAVLEITWDRVDFESRTIDLRVDDDGPRKGRAFVPMNVGANAILTEWKPMCDSDYVVEYKGGPIPSITNAFNKAVKRAGLKGVTPHVLRHTAAVHMVAAGHPMARVSQYLGHSSIAVTEKIYARFAPDHLRDEAASLDFIKGRSDLLLKALRQ